MSDRNSTGAGCLTIIGILAVVVITYGWLIPWLTVQAFSIWGIYLDQGQVFRTWLIVYLIIGALGVLQIKISD